MRTELDMSERMLLKVTKENNILREALERIAESRTSDRIRYDNDLRVSHDSNIKEAQDALLLAGKGEELMPLTPESVLAVGKMMPKPAPKPEVPLGYCPICKGGPRQPDCFSAWEHQSISLKSEGAANE